MNRKDIAIAIDTDGCVYQAQGGPAQASLTDDLADYEDDLYHSQLAHRVAIRLPGGEMKIAKPSDPEVREAVKVVKMTTHCRMTGSPRYIGRL